MNLCGNPAARGGGAERGCRDPGRSDGIADGRAPGPARSLCTRRSNRS